MKKILLMGPQGSGKGTQAFKLSVLLHIPAFGTGQLIRDEIAIGSEFGKKLHAIIISGDLVSDEDAAMLVRRRITQEDAKVGYIIDGYPRNVSQFHAFNFDSPTHVLVIDVPREESLKRLSGRLTCRTCGKVDSVTNGIKLGDHCLCGGVWYVRDDDTAEAIERRLEIYEHDTQPVILAYGSLVTRIDGMGTIDEVFERLVSVIK